ncbi:snaclec coagulation factor IX/factor X-binding protein subunit A-like [Mizuhopecten yessoensis]|uniref:snaclec coagulation factor IX/factor X-binding protein subunit A-like n=1 Tax=Mizuhopecten yessoensis TaxID=6573 RepID=UPI000B459779|nr:snaclec coagulation factor IX/factor X-binding protein subunit A-like [Mizuhopecten yessoensis]
MCVPAAPAYVCVKHEYSTVRCPEQWGRRDDLCFRMFREGKTWTEAKDVCASNGGQLLSLESEDDYLFHEFWITFHLRMKSSHPISGEIWTGFPYSSVLPGWVNSPNHVTSGSDLCMSLFYRPRNHGFVNTTTIENWKTVSCKEKNVFLCQTRAPGYWP